MGKAKARQAMDELAAIQNQQPLEQELSRTQIKKQMEALQQLGGRLIALKHRDLAKIPMSETLATAIEEAHRLTQNEAKRRHLQYIGKVMRNEDAEAIRLALARMNSSSDEHRRVFHQLERWRNGLLDPTKMQTSIKTLMEKYPDFDKQHIHALVRLAHKEAQQNKPPQASRKLFKYLRQLSNT